MIRITVVTPWYEHPELAHDYWEAMKAGIPDEVVVIQNGSPPGRDVVNDFSDTQYGELFRYRHHMVPRNLGFARACNRGLNDAERDAVLFLNNDIVMTKPGWLEAIREELRPGVLVGAELKAPSHTYVDGRAIPYLDGWCLAGMTEDLRALGGFDEAYEEPAYFGDNDLCLRARRAGMRLVQVDVGLRHISNVTSRSMDVSGVSFRNYQRYAARVRELLAAA